MAMPTAAIYGCSGTSLTAQEEAFFTRHNPLGFILFARNIESKEQVSALIAQFKACISHHTPLILVDQEGGRVARFAPPIWPAMPPAAHYLTQADGNLDEASQATEGAHYDCASWLTAMGVNVNCAPMLDVRFDFSDDIIGDRAFSEDAAIVAQLGMAAARGLVRGGVMPVIKHLPGHGRAMLDSHKALPVVNASREDLLADALPFTECCGAAFEGVAPLGMTAHIIYSAIDAIHCATHSQACIDFIRNEIGFKGLLMTDDLSMHALTGSFESRAEQALAAGCDIILHCNGNMEEMQAIASAMPLLQRNIMSYLPSPAVAA